MQRLFSMFPPGWPGLALLLLRLSVALGLLFELHDLRQAISSWIYVAAVLLSVSLCAGLLTPFGALATLAWHLVVWWMVAFPGSGSAAMIILNALALTLIGPGAYSIDAYRFGRRVVVIPPR